MSTYIGGAASGARHRWSSAFSAVMVLGAACGVVHWGWRQPVVAAATIAAGVVCLRLGSWARLRDAGVDPVALVGDSLEAGVVVVAMAGLLAASVPLALLAVLGLVVAAPRARRVARELVVVRRWSHEVSYGLRWSGAFGRNDVSRS